MRTWTSYVCFGSHGISACSTFDNFEPPSNLHPAPQHFRGANRRRRDFSCAQSLIEERTSESNDLAMAYVPSMHTRKNCQLLLWPNTKFNRSVYSHLAKLYVVVLPWCILRSILYGSRVVCIMSALPCLARYDGDDVSKGTFSVGGFMSNMFEVIQGTRK